MATLIVNEASCFKLNNFSGVLTGSISFCYWNLFFDEELIRAIAVLHKVCVKAVGEDQVTRVITRKSENRRKLMFEDLMKFVTLFNEHKIVDFCFVAMNLLRVLLIEPGSIDLCFLLVTVSEMKIQVRIYLVFSLR